jgi:hypothetical protein
VPAEIRVDGMVEESWKLLNELLTTGQMTLSNKKIVLPSPELLIRTIADIAKLKPPKVRKMANTDGLRVKKTSGG